MMTSNTDAPPEQGRLVEVRQRRFVVSDVRSGVLPDGLLHKSGARVQHLATLSSVEDDALGEELRVVWEIEPGTRIYERATLPDPTAGFDPAERLDAFLDAVRWGGASLADVRSLQAPFRSGIDIEDYQLDPLIRAVQMPRANLLIADDVGLGKTIEAGLVCQELILRHRVRRILVVCPSALQIQWQDQMRDKFGLEFRIVDSALMKELRRRRGIHVNPWTHFPRLITSIDFLKRERPMRLFRDTLPPEGQPAYPRRYDLMIVDEAHNAAPSGGGQYAIDSLRTAAIRTLAPHFEHKLFLTATPHNGYQESFTALLELLDNQRFARGVPPDREQLNAIMVRRLKSELPPRWDGTARFAARKLVPLEVDYTEKEQRAHSLLQQYALLRQARSESPAEKYATEFVLKLLKKRMLSSPAAFATTLARHEQTVRGAFGGAPGLGALQRQVDAIDEEFADDDLYEETAEDAVETAGRMLGGLSDEEQAALRGLREWGQSAAGQPDSKSRALIQWLRENVKPGGVWSDRRAIIFTEYRTTQNWLHQLLSQEGLAEERGGRRRLLTLYGGMPSEQREAIKAAFQADPAVSDVRILLATDAASEGIDLQRHCSRLIHYEIPWNPNRMEQRNGRVDRHGQRAPEVTIYHFVCAGYQARLRGAAHQTPGALEADLEFLMRAALKVDAIRQDLGKVGPVIATQVEEAMLGRRTQLDTDAAEASARPIRRLLTFQRKLDEEIGRFRDQLDATRTALRFSPENVRAIVSVGLDLAGQPPLQNARLAGIRPDPSGRRKECPLFHLPALSGSWAQCSEGLKHPHTGEVRPITFDADVAQGRDDVVLAHLNHRLVQMCLRLLRAEVWAPRGRQSLARVAARLTSDRGLENPVVVVHGRLVVLGAKGQRLHEELIAAGAEIQAGQLVRLSVNRTRAALDAALPQDAPDPVRRRLADLWPEHEKPLRQALEARMRDRAEGLRRDLQERADKEVSDVRAILTELQRQIETEITQPIQLQLDLFGGAEREQWERNRSSLEERLREIPGEIERETEAIRARFAEPTPRLFPVAVTYLVPERVARATLG